MTGEAPDFRLELPVPPSTNALFTYRSGSRQRIKTDVYRAWITEAGWALKPWAYVGDTKSTIRHARVELDLPLTHQRDIDNSIKPILDLLVRHRLIEDDRWVEELLVRRVPVTEKLTVSIWRL